MRFEYVAILSTSFNSLNLRNYVNNVLITLTPFFLPKNNVIQILRILLEQACSQDSKSTLNYF